MKKGRSNLHFPRMT